MTGKGDFIKKPVKQFRLLILMQAIWTVTIIVLVAWWATLLKSFADEIANLQTQLGQSYAFVESQLSRRGIMIAGESAFFLIVVLIINAVLVVLAVREQRRSKALQSFFASFTHELRTPLTSLKLQAESIQEFIPKTHEAWDYVERLLEDVSRLEMQVQKTLELARVEGGGDVHPRPVNLTQAVRYFYKQLPTKSLKIDDRLGEATGLADPAALTIIMRNITDNALKYTAEGPAQLEIHSELNADSRTTLRFEHMNSRPTGLDPALLGKIFSRGDYSQGAGVGLYLVKTLMEKMGGACTFKVNDSRFAVILLFKGES